jgi:hypothetical protein
VSDGRLYLQFAEHELSVEPGNTLTFGRGGELVVDDANPYLHRTVGEFTCRHDVWWLSNVGSAVTLTLSDPLTPTQSTIAPGGECAIAHSEFVLRFSAGPTTYEIEGSADSPEEVTSRSEEFDHLDRTLQWGVVDLNAEQRLLLTALAEQHLLEPGTDPVIPPSKQIARRLSWSISKFNRKLDHLCDKFARAGVSGLRGDLGEVANERRKRLVQHGIQSGLLTADDLDLLHTSEPA